MKKFRNLFLITLLSIISSPLLTIKASTINEASSNENTTTILDEESNTIKNISQETELTVPTELLNIFSYKVAEAIAFQLGDDITVYSLVTQQDLNTIQSLFITFYQQDQISLIGMEYLKNLESLSLSSSKIMQADLEIIGSLPSLKSLSFYGTEIASLNQISAMQSLKALTLSNTNLNETDLKPFENNTNLVSINLLGNFTDLQILDTLPNLEQLQIMSSTLAALPKFTNSKKLNSLSLHLIPKVSDFSSITNLDSLTELTITGSKYEDETITRVNLENYNFLENLLNLKKLQLILTNFRDTSVFKNLSNLETLSLSSNFITDVTPLSQLPKLEYVDLDYNGIIDISPLSNINAVTAVRQTSYINVTPPTPFPTNSILINNPIKTLDGSLVSPNEINKGGTYDGEYFVFSNININDKLAVTFGINAYAPTLPSDEDLENIAVYSDMEDSTISNTPGLLFSGTVVFAFSAETPPTNDTSLLPETGINNYNSLLGIGLILISSISVISKKKNKNQ